MKQTAKKWYLLAYDIREPKRLKRTHYYVKKVGISLQRSVFLIRVDGRALKEIRKNIQQRVNKREDDVRLYPIRHPGVIWAAGQQSTKINTLFASVPSKNSRKLTAKIRKLFRRKKK